MVRFFNWKLFLELLWIGSKENVIFDVVRVIVGRQILKSFVGYFKKLQYWKVIKYFELEDKMIRLIYLNYYFDVEMRRN